MDVNPGCCPSLRTKVRTYIFNILSPLTPFIVNGYVPSLTPSHTGATFPHPHSPQQTGNSYASPPLIGPASDYELGFKQGAHSPSSQVFVVRHNPSPFNGRLSEIAKARGSYHSSCHCSSATAPSETQTSGRYEYWRSGSWCRGDWI